MIDESLMEYDKFSASMKQKYPELSKHQRGGFEINSGWYHIIDLLFYHISSYVREQRSQRRRDLIEVRAYCNRGLNLQQVTHALSNGNPSHYKFYEEKAKKLLDGTFEVTKRVKFPKIQQIKEKFGSLRIYTQDSDEVILALIDFAISMSDITCEVCGERGVHRNTSWIRVLCDKHYQEK